MLYALRRKTVECGKEYKNYSDIILCNKNSHVPDSVLLCELRSIYQLVYYGGAIIRKIIHHTRRAAL